MTCCQQRAFFLLRTSLKPLNLIWGKLIESKISILYKAKEKYRGVFEIQKSGDKTSPGESLCFSGRSENQDVATNVAHCTQVHDMWPFGPLVLLGLAHTCPILVTYLETQIMIITYDYIKDKMYQVMNSISEPCPSEVLQKVLREVLLGNHEAATRFLDTLITQLNWSFSEFVGMMQEVGCFPNTNVLVGAQLRRGNITFQSLKDLKNIQVGSSIYHSLFKTEVRVFL